MISGITLIEAENWASNWGVRLIGMIAEAQQMNQFAAANFTEEMRKRGALVAGVDRKGQPKGWTDNDLEAVQEAYKAIALAAATMQARQADGTSVLMEIQSFVRPMRNEHPAQQ